MTLVIEELVIQPNSEFDGITIQESQLRQKETVIALGSHESLSALEARLQVMV